MVFDSLSVVAAAVAVSSCSPIPGSTAHLGNAAGVMKEKQEWMCLGPTDYQEYAVFGNIPPVTYLWNKYFFKYPKHISSFNSFP